MVPVSVLIIAKNEEAHMARCLEALFWADDVLVVDAESTDGTLAVCRGYKNVRTLSRKWTNFRDQRNFALTNAKHDWVFVVDADERCSPELGARITLMMSQGGGPELKAYKVRRVEYFLGKEIRYGIWNPSYQDRFFNRKGVEYVNEIHEYPRFHEPPGLLDEPLLHQPDFSPDKFLDKMNRYTTIEARDRVAAGQRTSWFKILFAFPAMFYKNYFYYGAFRDGMHGFVISLLEGVSRVVRHIKMWQAAEQGKGRE